MEGSEHSSSGDCLSLADETVVGTCAICLDSICVHNEAFVYDCFHHFCFKCILGWSKKSLRTEGSVPCPVCRLPFVGIIHCFEAENDARMYDISNNSDSPWAIEGLKLTPIQMRRRSLYVASSSIGLEDAKKQTAISIPLCNLERSAFKLWLLRELQSILLMEDVQLIAEHILGSLLQQTGAAKKSGTQFPGAYVAELIESSVFPYIGEHSKRLALEALTFIQANLTLEAYDLLQKTGTSIDACDVTCDFHEHLDQDANQTGQATLRMRSQISP